MLTFDQYFDSAGRQLWPNSRSFIKHFAKYLSTISLLYIAICSLYPQYAWASARANLAYPVVSGAFGPFSNVHVKLEFADSNDNGFKGIIKTDIGDFDLAPPDEPVDLFEIRILSVSFAKCCKQKFNDIIIFYIAQHLAPGSSTYNAACVYRWNGKSIYRVHSIEKKLYNSKSVKELHKRFSRL